MARMSIAEFHKMKNLGGSKYRNEKTSHAGTVFDSKKEAAYARTLDSMMKAKDPADRVVYYDIQVEFPIVIRGKKCFVYKADFKVIYADGHEEIVDVKGMRTPVYRLKKKCVEAEYGITIVEV